MESKCQAYGFLSRMVSTVQNDGRSSESLSADSAALEQAILNLVATLSAKLERDAAEPTHLLTVRGVGYKWNALAVNRAKTRISSKILLMPQPAMTRIRLASGAKEKWI